MLIAIPFLPQVFPHYHQSFKPTLELITAHFCLVWHIKSLKDLCRGTAGLLVAYLINAVSLDGRPSLGKLEQSLESRGKRSKDDTLFRFWGDFGGENEGENKITICFFISRAMHNFVLVYQINKTFTG